MGVAAFMKKGLGVAIQYETDSQQHIFIKKDGKCRDRSWKRKNSFSSTEEAIRMDFF